MPQVELQKYKPRAHKAAVSFDRGAGPLGGLDLRYTVNQIQALLEDLHNYRPAKGEHAIECDDGSQMVLERTLQSWFRVTAEDDGDVSSVNELVWCLSDLLHNWSHHACPCLCSSRLQGAHPDRVVMYTRAADLSLLECSLHASQTIAGARVWPVSYSLAVWLSRLPSPS
jgi:hypothetical protein